MIRYQDVADAMPEHLAAAQHAASTAHGHVRLTAS